MKHPWALLEPLKIVWRALIDIKMQASLKKKIKILFQTFCLWNLLQLMLDLIRGQIHLPSIEIAKYTFLCLRWETMIHINQESPIPSQSSSICEATGVVDGISCPCVSCSPRFLQQPKERNRSLSSTILLILGRWYISSKTGESLAWLVLMQTSALWMFWSGCNEFHRVSLSVAGL